jgi:hypothetical protein
MCSCTHLVTGGQRFLIFPELRECCMCCAAAAGAGASGGCGATLPDWLGSGQFVGVAPLRGGPAYKWVIPAAGGLQTSYYYATPDKARQQQRPLAAARRRPLAAGAAASRSSAASLLPRAPHHHAVPLPPRRCSQAQLPLELDIAPGGAQSFKLGTYSRLPVPASAFALPSYCTDKCPVASLCSVTSAASSAAAAVADAVSSAASGGAEGVHRIRRPQ